MPTSIAKLIPAANEGRGDGFRWRDVDKDISVSALPGLATLR